DHVLHPLVFALGQLAFLLPALAIAAAVIWPQPKGEDAAMPGAAKADAFDRRIVTLLAFGPAATTVAISALSGRGAIAMWGYPLWLFLGLWIVLHPRTAIEPARLGRIAAAWAGLFAPFAPDLGDVRSKGAVVVWTGSADPSDKEGGIDPTVMPVGLRAVAGDAQIQPPFTLPFRRGDRVLTVGWAILRPQPAFARH